MLLKKKKEKKEKQLLFISRMPKLCAILNYVYLVHATQLVLIIQFPASHNLEM